MSITLRACAVFAALAGASVFAAAPAPEQAIPVADFFKQPSFDDAKLSPSGRYLAGKMPGKGGRMHLAVVDLDAPTAAVADTGFFDADVNQLQWVNENRLVFEVIDSQSGNGDQYGSGLYAVNRDGSELRALISLRQLPVSHHSNIATKVLPGRWVMHATLGDGSDQIVVAEREDTVRGDIRGLRLARLDTRTGLLSRMPMEGAPEAVFDWVLDRQGVPRVAVSEIEGMTRIYVRPTAEAPWRLLQEASSYTGDSFKPAFIDFSDTLYLLQQAGDGGHEVMYRYDMAKLTREDQPFLVSAGFDVSARFQVDNKARRVLGLHYLSDGRASAWFAPEFKQLQAQIDKLLPVTANEISCGDCLSSDRVLVKSWSDMQPEFYSLYERKEGKLHTIGATRPWIDAKRMGRQDFVRYKARDGLIIPAYVTYPPMRQEGPMPAVVLVHGGPWVRGGEWGWEAQAQFLASRGYLVIAPEFRGSTGFGLAHFRASWKQWGLAMQDDLADAVQWAVDKKLADPSRVCIIGASYGGYAALMGLVRHAQTYQCAVEWAGVTDIDLMYSIGWTNLPDRWKRHGMPLLIGDRDKDAQQLRDASPLQQAQRITKPVLLAYGALDRRVPIDHGTKLRDAVRKHNAEVEWVVYPDEGHGWLIEANKVDFWSRVERFLERNLNAKAAN